MIIPCNLTNRFLLPEYEIDGCHQTEESSGVVPVEMFTLKHKGSDDSEDSKGNHFLNHLQLHE